MTKQLNHLMVLAAFGFGLSSASPEPLYGAFLPVCDRTPEVKTDLETQTAKKCADITEDDLLKIVRVAVESGTIKNFKADDFSGLKNLDILNIRSNPYTELPEGLFNDLGNLKTLVIISTKLRNYPDDFLATTPNIENLHVFRTQVRSISESILTRMESMRNLKVIDFDRKLQEPERVRLQKIFPAGGSTQLFFR